MNVEELSESKKRVLDAAEIHFMKRGYAAVTLLDVADHLGIKQASLYYHAPGGKQDLFEQVIRFAMIRHAGGIESALNRAPSNARDQLESIIEWLASQPPLPLMRLLSADIPHLEHKSVDQLTELAQRAIVAPIRNVFERAIDRGEIRGDDPGLMSRAFLSLLGGATEPLGVEQTPEQRRSTSNQLLDMMFQGLALHS